MYMKLESLGLRAHLELICSKHKNEKDSTLFRHSYATSLFGGLRLFDICSIDPLESYGSVCLLRKSKEDSQESTHCGSWS